MSESLEVRVAPGTVKELGDLLEKMDQVALSAAKMAGSGKALEELRKIFVGIGKSGSAFSELRQSMDSLNKGLTDSIKQMVATVENLPVKLAESMKGMSVTMKASGEAAGKALGEGLAAGADKSLTDATQTVRAAVAKLQKAYETAVAEGAVFSAESLQRLRTKGVSLFPTDREVIADSRRFKSAVASESASQIQIMEAVRVAQLRMSQDVLAGMREFYTGMENNAAAISAVWEKLGALATGDTGLRLLSSRLHEDSTLILTEMASFYQGMERSEAQLAAVLARFGSLATKDNGLRLLKSSLHEDSQLILAEMAKFYRGLEESEAQLAAVWGKMGKLATADNGLRLLKSSLHEDSQLVLAEMRQFYTQMEVEQARLAKIADLKNAIRGRLYLNKPAASMPQTAPSSEETLAAMREYYLANGAVQNVPSVPTIDPVKTRAGTAALKEQTAHMPIWRDHANDMHSAARGLASGFNLLWLTWGNMIPLLAGAAISNGVAQTIKSGADVEHTMALIGAMTQSTSADMALLNQNLLDLAHSGPFGPKEIAEAMKTLSQAGLTAKETMQALQPTLNFSVAGDIGIQKAADTLTAVTTAFNMGATGFSRAGDIVAKTAAVSKTSVEAMAGAFKTASVLNAQYGVSLEDVGTGLAVVANLGIEGSAAGTALRNMYSDLGGRTKEVSKILAEHKIQLRELSTGQFPDLIKVVQQLDTEFKKLTPMAAQNLFKDLTSERGAKPLVELIELIRKLPKEASSNLSSRLEEIRQQISESYAFAASVAIEANLTTTNQFKSLMAGFKADMVDAFKDVAPALNVLIHDLKAAFSDGSLKTALVEITATVLEFGRVIVEHGKVFATIAAAWLTARASLILLQAAMAVGPAVMAAWSAAVGIFSVVEGAAATATVGLTSAVALNSAGMASAAPVVGTFSAAAGALGGTSTAAATGVATLSASLVPIIGLLALVAAGFATWYYWKKKTADDIKVEAGKNDFNSTLEALKAEEERLRKETDVMRNSKSLDEAAMRMQQEEKFAKASLGLAQERLAAEKELSETKALQARYQTDDKLIKNIGTYAAAKDYAALQPVIVEQEMKLNDIRRRETAQLREFNSQLDRTTAAAKENAQANAELSKRGTLGQGTGTYTGLAKNTGRAESVVKDVLAYENALHSARLEALRRAATEEKQILDASHKAKLISEGEYQAQSLAALYAADSKQLDEAYRHQVEGVKQIDAAMKRLNLNAGGDGSVVPSGKFATALQAQGKAFEALDPKMKSAVLQYRELSLTLEKLNLNYETETKKINDEAHTRERLLDIEMGGKIAAEAAAYKKLEKAIDVTNTKELEKFNLASSAIVVSERQMASDQARLHVEQEFAGAIANRTEALANFVNLQSALYTAMEGVDTSTEAGLEQFNKLMQKYTQAGAAVATFTAALTKMKEEVSAAGSGAALNAQAVFDRKEAIKTRDNIADALVQGIMKGRDAAKSIWVTMRDWLKNLFANTVLKPVMQNVTGGVMNYLGMGSNSSSGASSGIVNSMVGTSLGNYLGVSTVGGLAGSSAAYGAAIGTTNFAAGSQAAMLAEQTGSFGVAGLTSTVEAAGGMMSTLAAAAPYIAAAIAVAYALSKESTPHTGGYSYSDAKGTSDITAAQGGIQNTETQKLMTDLSTSLSGTLNGLATDFGKEAVYGVKAVFESDKNDPSWGIFKVNKNGQEAFGSVPGVITNMNSDPTKGLTEYGATAAKGTRDAMLAMDFLPQWFKKALNDLGDTIDVDKLNSTVTELRKVQVAIVGVQNAMKPMGGVFATLADRSSDAFANMGKASGGLDKLSSNVADYYTNFYTETERNGQAMTYLTGEFEKLNLGAMPKTKQGFRELIDGFIAGGKDLQEGGDQTLATLFQLANGFSTVDAAINSTVKDNSKRNELEIAKMRALGDEAGAVAKERDLEIEALKKTNPELVDLQREVWTLADAAAKAAAALSERNTLEDEWYNLIGDTDTLRRRERGAIDSTNLALFDRIRALKDEKAATQMVTDATAALVEAAQTALNNVQTAINNQKAALKTQYDADVKALDNLIKSEKTKLSDASVAVDRLTKAVSNLKSLTDTLLSTLKSMKMIGTEGSSRAAAQAQIAQALAAAKATGIMPSVDSLKDALSTVAQPSEDLFSSFVDYQRDFYLTANNVQALYDLATKSLATNEDALAVAQAQKDAAENQITNLNDQKDKLTETYDGNVSALDRQMADAQRQYDGIMTVNSSVLTVNGTLMGLTGALNVYKAGTGDPSGMPTKDLNKWITSGGASVYTDAAGAYAIRTKDSPVGTAAATGIDKTTYTVDHIREWVTASLKDGNLQNIKDRMGSFGLSFTGLDSLMTFAPGTMQALLNPDAGKIQNSSLSDIRGFVNYWLERNDPRQIYQKAKDNGISSYSLDAIMGWARGTAADWAAKNGLTAFAGGGMHSGGLALVGERGPEVVNLSPSRVYSAEQTKSILSGDRNDAKIDALIAEMTALREESKQARIENRALQEQAVINTGQTARQLQRWDVDGMPAVTV